MFRHPSISVLPRVAAVLLLLNTNPDLSCLRPPRISRGAGYFLTGKAEVRHCLATREPRPETGFLKRAGPKGPGSGAKCQYARFLLFSFLLNYFFFFFPLWSFYPLVCCRYITLGAQRTSRALFAHLFPIRLCASHNQPLAPNHRPLFRVEDGTSFRDTAGSRRTLKLLLVAAAASAITAFLPAVRRCFPSLSRADSLAPMHVAVTISASLSLSLSLSL